MTSKETFKDTKSSNFLIRKEADSVWIAGREIEFNWELRQVELILPPQRLSRMQGHLKFKMPNQERAA
jgi:hypothetical protein